LVVGADEDVWALAAVEEVEVEVEVAFGGD
jgi:hypothetical protein